MEMAMRQRMAVAAAAAAAAAVVMAVVRRRKVMRFAPCESTMARAPWFVTPLPLSFSAPFCLAYIECGGVMGLVAAGQRASAL